MVLQKNKKKKLPPSFIRLTLKCLNEAVELTAYLVETVKKRDEELKSDRICGHWLGLDIDCSATVIKVSTGYMISFFHDGMMTEQLSVVLYEGKLQIAGISDSVFLLDEDRLVIGKNGTYIRDHILGYTSTNSVEYCKSKKLKYKQFNKEQK